MTRDRNPLANRAQATTAAKLPALMRPKAGDWTALLSWVDAVSEHLRVRQGSARNPLEATVTKRELQAATGVQQVIFTNGQGQGGATPSSGGSTVMMQSASGQWVGVTVEAFADLIRNTRLYTDLTGAIDDPTRFDRLTKEVREILLPDLNALALSRGTDIRQTDTKIQDASQSLAARVNELTAAFGRNTAGIRQAMITQATQGSASAVYALQITSRLDGFDGGVATIEEVFSTLADRTSGLAAEYMLKLSAGKAVVGFGLAASEDPLGNTVSDFWIEAGRFAITAPFTFAQESTPTAAVIGQTWYKPSTKATKRATATGTGSWVTFAPKVPFGIDTTTDTIYLDGTVLINAGGRPLQAQNAHAYATGSSWSDSTANSALSTLTGSSTKKIGDTVTIANGSTFWQEKYWSGSAWVDPGVVINGNLLVSGTVSASVINGGTFAGAAINIGSGQFTVDASTGAVVAFSFIGSCSTFSNAANPSGHSLSAGVIPGSTGDAIRAVMGYTAGGLSTRTGVAITAISNSDQSTSHAFRGTYDKFGTSTAPARGTNNGLYASGIVGCNNGNAFYCENGAVGPFTGSHEVAVPVGSEYVAGDIMVDVECLLRNGLSNTLFSVAPSSAANERAPIGVLTYVVRPMNQTGLLAAAGQLTVDEDGIAHGDADFEAVKNDYLIGMVNALGEGQMNVCGEGGDIEAGDYITTSSVQGKGMRQSPFVMTLPGGATTEVQLQCNFTVAKAREAVTFSEAGEVKTIACTYHCG